MHNKCLWVCALYSVVQGHLWLFRFVCVNFTVVQHLKTHVSMCVNGWTCYVYLLVCLCVTADRPFSFWRTVADVFPKQQRKRYTHTHIYTYFYLFVRVCLKPLVFDTHNAPWIRCAACKSWQAENIRYTVDRAGKILSIRWLYNVHMHVRSRIEMKETVDAENGRLSRTQSNLVSNSLFFAWNINI